MAGIGESLVLVAFCGLCTFLTSISLSAIATNGAMKVHFLGWYVLPYYSYNFPNKYMISNAVVVLPLTVLFQNLLICQWTIKSINLNKEEHSIIHKL